MSSAPYRTKKHLGQHFLADKSVIDRIIAVIAPREGQSFLEIGPGMGALTRALLPLVKVMDVVEIDGDVLKGLQQACEGLGHLHIHHQDALRFDFNQLAHQGPWRVVGNLPYNISSPLLFHLMSFLPQIQDMHFMLQKEVVLRMAARAGDSAYGRLSVMLQYHCEIEALLSVPPTAFRPPPKVDSAVVRLLPYRQLPAVATDYACFEGLVKLAFNQRRKTLKNTLKTLCVPEDFSAAEIDSQQRAETLTAGEFVRLSNIVGQRLLCSGK
jgi:16S rRNA (adenine1518-N6/adenine1519-N6)-dimethyltransferase